MIQDLAVVTIILIGVFSLFIYFWAKKGSSAVKVQKYPCYIMHKATGLKIAGFIYEFDARDFLNKVMVSWNAEAYVVVNQDGKPLDDIYEDLTT